MILLTILGVFGFIWYIYNLKKLPSIRKMKDSKKIWRARVKVMLGILFFAAWLIYAAVGYN